MPILHSIVHLIDKQPDGQPATLHGRDSELAVTPALEDLLESLNDSYNGKPKSWGFFNADAETYPFSVWLAHYLDGEKDFVAFSRQAAEHLKTLMEGNNLSVGGHVLFVHYRHGESDYLAIALLHHSEGVSVTESLDVAPARQLDMGQLHLAARIDLSDWRRDDPSRQYISFIKGKGSKRIADYFRDFIGHEEGIDASGETRTLLKAFSDYVESEDFAEEQAREKTETLIDYASNQARSGQPITLDELSELVDESQPKAFYDYIRNKDYGLSSEIPPDKRTLHQFRRFAGRAGGLSVSFDTHLLGSQVEYDEENDKLTIHKVPPALRDQIKRRKE
jgi:nucleoid-associated protein